MTEPASRSLHASSGWWLAVTSLLSASTMETAKRPRAEGEVPGPFGVGAEAPGEDRLQIHGAVG